MSFNLIRKELDPGELYPLSLRLNDGVVQYSADGGATWADSPGQDPRKMILLPPRATGDLRCDGAANAEDWISNWLSVTLTAVSEGTGALGVVALILPLLIELGPFAVLFELVLAVVAEVISAGSTAVAAALTSTVWTELKCILYCRMHSDGALDAAALANVRADVNSQIGGLAAVVLNLVFDVMGYAGITDAGRTGTVTGSCGGCTCGSLCIDFTDLSRVAFGPVPGFPSVPPGGYSASGGNPGASARCAYAHVGSTYYDTIAVWVDLGDEYTIDGCAVDYWYNHNAGGNVWARNFLLFNAGRILIAQVGDTAGGTKSAWHNYAPSISHAGIRFVVAQFGVSSGAAFTGDGYLDNFCINYH